MIVGMTHDEGGIVNNVTKYKGKISTGYEPNETPNTRNSPVAAGFYRMLKEIVKNQRIGVSQEIVSIKDWVLNTEVQKELEKANNNNPQPKRIEIYSLVKTSGEMWESFLAKFSKTEGLLCKSHGKNTIAKQLVVGPNGERKWEDRFTELGGCPFRECPDFKEGNCKSMGMMKCFPTIDLNPNPYRFETRSINTIIGFESTFTNLETLLKAAHMVKQIEAGKILPYDGFFGARLFMVHKKVKSGGRDVFISDLIPTPDFTDSVMEPIKRGLAARSKQSKMIGGSAGSVSLLGDASEKMLEASRVALIEDANVDGVVPISLDEQKDIAVQFGSDAGDIDVSDVSETVTVSTDNGSEAINLRDVIVKKQASEKLLNEGIKK
jgi:hypothetical protein